MNPTPVAVGDAEAILMLSLVLWPLWWLFAAGAVGAIATERGRSFVEWFAISIFLSPIFAALLLIAAGDNEEKAKHHIQEIVDALRRSRGRGTPAEQPTIAPVPAPSAVKYRVSRLDSSQVHLSVVEILEELKTKALSLECYYWDRGAKDWKRLAEHPEL